VHAAEEQVQRYLAGKPEDTKARVLLADLYAAQGLIDIHARFRINLPEMEQEGFEIVGNHIEFYGRCSKCKNKKH
jgi:hypothetical protein